MTYSIFRDRGEMMRKATAFRIILPLSKLVISSEARNLPTSYTVSLFIRRGTGIPFHQSSLLILQQLLKISHLITEPCSFNEIKL